MKPPEVVIHPDDAAAALSNNQALIARSGHGELTGVAKVDAIVRRGAVWSHTATRARMTSRDDIDVVTG